MRHLRLILASQSPRRLDLLSQLLKKIGYDRFPFCVHPANLDETIGAHESPVEAVKRLASEKAGAVAQSYVSVPFDLILSADTIVTIPPHRILGKPTDADDARSMLRSLSGRTHDSLTACSLIFLRTPTITSGKSFSPTHDILTVCDSTAVTFRHMSDDDIDTMIASGEPFDKAGAYGIQGLARKHIESIDGDINTVIGLPLLAIESHLTQLFSSMNHDKLIG